MNKIISLLFKVLLISFFLLVNTNILSAINLEEEVFFSNATTGTSLIKVQIKIYGYMGELAVALHYYWEPAKGYEDLRLPYDNTVVVEFVINSTRYYLAEGGGKELGPYEWSFFNSRLREKNRVFFKNLGTGLNFSGYLSEDDNKYILEQLERGNYLISRAFFVTNQDSLYSQKIKRDKKIEEDKRIAEEKERQEEERLKKEQEDLEKEERLVKEKLLKEKREEEEKTFTEQRQKEQRQNETKQKQKDAENERKQREAEEKERARREEEQRKIAEQEEKTRRFYEEKERRQREKEKLISDTIVDLNQKLLSAAGGLTFETGYKGDTYKRDLVFYNGGDKVYTSFKGYGDLSLTLRYHIAPFSSGFFGFNVNIFMELLLWFAQAEGFMAYQDPNNMYTPPIFYKDQTFSELYTGVMMPFGLGFEFRFMIVKNVISLGFVFDAGGKYYFSTPVGTEKTDYTVDDIQTYWSPYKYLSDDNGGIGLLLRPGITVYFGSFASSCKLTFYMDVSPLYLENEPVLVVGSSIAIAWMFDNKEY